jgi:hypothetical protein
VVTATSPRSSWSSSTPLSVLLSLELGLMRTSEFSRTKVADVSGGVSIDSPEKMTELSDKFPFSSTFPVACSIAKGATTGWTARDAVDGDDGGCRAAVVAAGSFWVAISDFELGACESCSPLETGGTTAGGEELGGCSAGWFDDFFATPESAGNVKRWVAPVLGWRMRCAGAGAVSAASGGLLGTTGAGSVKVRGGVLACGAALGCWEGLIRSWLATAVF